MKVKMISKSCRIQAESKTLDICLEGETDEDVRGEKLRLMAVFYGGGQDRRFPLVGRFRPEAGGKRLFDVDSRIALEAVFYEYVPTEDVRLEIWHCDLQEGWSCLSREDILPAELFVRENAGETCLARAGRMILYILCTLLLPVWLADGALAVCGRRPLHAAAKGMQGKKAVIYHAHGLVHGWTGYGYSVREIKTGYFKRQYERACRRGNQTEGVLLLSERKVDEGGNLDRIRGRLAENGSVRVEEFLLEKPVHKLSWKELRRIACLIADAAVVVLEDFYPQLHALSIRPETQVLQLWHACGAFKLFGLSELGIVSHLEQTTRNHRSYSAAICSSHNIVPFYSEAYGISESCVHPVGVPRTDVFFDEEYRVNVRERLLREYPVLQGKRVILFAPTFRGSGNKTAYYPMERFPVEDILDSLPEDVVLVVKNHPFVKERLQVGAEYSQRVLDLSDRENINDILFVTGLLITDYSSVIFEAALLRIPMLFYVFDLEEYLCERDLYFDFASFIPGEMIQREQELADAIQRAWEQGETERYVSFCDFFLDSLDGKSTERTMELLYELLSR